GCAACAAATHPQNGYRNTSQYASYEAQLLNGELALAGHYHIDLEGAVTWAFTFPGHPYFVGFRSLSTHGIDKPVLSVFRMLGMMSGDRLESESSGAVSFPDLLHAAAGAKPDINVMAARDGNEISVLLWNYDDSAEAAPPAQVAVTIASLPRSARRLFVEHFRVDQSHSNAFTLWKSMGSPQHPCPEQVARLKDAGQLHLLASPSWRRPKNGALSLRFELPRQAVSLLRISWSGDQPN
ncbi:MAG: beta-xylosidase, partial [Acidobacteriota bacterium]|nr:beta-xylosidase [Acidobacteriota bacterium]